MMLLVWALLAFDPTATLGALDDETTRAGALEQVLKLNAEDLKMARKAGLATRIGQSAQDTKIPFKERVLSVRVAALLKDNAALAALKTLAGKGDSPESVALARESARALRQLGAASALNGLLAHSDPEVRRHAAAGALDGDGLCQRLKGDAWPKVRAAAARRLASVRPQCLDAGFKDADAGVLTATIEAAGQGKEQALIKPLRAVAGDAKAPVSQRQLALIALGKNQHTAPAHTVLETHLKTGGIVPLATAALRALAAAGGDEDLALLRRGLTSKAPSVAFVAARLLLAQKDRESLAEIQALMGRLEPRQQATLRGLLSAEISDPEDPALSDPE